MQYFLVTVTRGHLGGGHGREITFAIRANDITKACKKATMMPGIQHSKPPLRAVTIAKDEYDMLIKESAYVYANGNQDLAREALLKDQEIRTNTNQAAKPTRRQSSHGTKIHSAHR